MTAKKAPAAPVVLCTKEQRAVLMLRLDQYKVYNVKAKKAAEPEMVKRARRTIRVFEQDRDHRDSREGARFNADRNATQTVIYFGSPKDALAALLKFERTWKKAKN